MQAPDKLATVILGTRREWNPGRAAPEMGDTRLELGAWPLGGLQCPVLGPCVQVPLPTRTCILLCVGGFYLGPAGISLFSKCGS